MIKELSDDQQAIDLLNVLGDKYSEIRNALEYGRKDLTVAIIISILRNRELMLKIEAKDSKFGKGLNIKKKLNQNKKKNQCNYNSLRKWKFQTPRF